MNEAFQAPGSLTDQVPVTRDLRMTGLGSRILGRWGRDIWDPPQRAV